LNASHITVPNVVSLPDALDLQIIEALRADPLTTNKAMAQSFGVAEPTIAARIRSMAERGVMRVTVQRDLTALGFPVFAFLDVYSDGRPAADIASDLVEIEEATSVVTSLGGPEILVNLYAKTQTDLQSLIEGPISSTKGIRRVELHVCLETLKQLSGYGNLAGGVPNPKKPTSSEDVDEAVISLLAEDGRRSNRDMARQLDLSEGAIRQRLKRLTEGKVIKRGVICDPWMIGQNSSAIARMWVDPPHIRALKKALCNSPACFFAAKTTGRFNFIALFVADTLESIETSLSEVTSKSSGVLEVDVKVLIRGFKHRYDLVNLV
jgi:DNA-binding Lrp family transcriptional regulator